MEVNEDNILFFTNWSFNEGLIQAYTLPYVTIIQNIRKKGFLYLVTEEKEFSKIDQKEIDEKNKSLFEYRVVWKPRPYLPLGWKKGFSILKELGLWSTFVLKKKIKIFHSLCSPAGVYAYLLSFLVFKRRRLIIDSFEPHSYYMEESGVWNRKSLAYRFLCCMEKRMVKRADFVIGATNSMKEFSARVYGAKNTNDFFVKPACVDLDKFKFSDEDRKAIRNLFDLDGETIIGVYVGKFGGIYLSNEIFDFFRQAYDFWEQKFFLLVLSPQGKEEIVNLCRESGFPEAALLLKNVPHTEVKKYLSAADFGLCPVKPSPSRKYCTPIKNGEYWATGLPIIITKEISDDSDIIEKEDGGVVIQELDGDGYKEALSKLDHLLKMYTKNELRYHIRRIANEYRNFNIAFDIYSKIYTKN